MCDPESLLGGERGSLSRPLPSSLPHLVPSLTCLMQNHLWGSSSAGHMRSHAALSTAARGRPTMNEGLNGEWTPGPFQSAPSSLPRLPSGFWGLARHLPQVTCSLWASFSSHTNFKIYLLLFTVYTRSFTLTVSSDPQSPARGGSCSCSTVEDPASRWGDCPPDGTARQQDSASASPAAAPMGSRAVNEDTG